jgi:hypothetical protein
LEATLDLLLGSPDFNSKQFLEVVTKKSDAALSIVRIFTRYLHFQKNSFAFFKELHPWCGLTETREILQLIVSQNQFSGDSEFLKQLAKSDDLVILKSILQLDALVIEDTSALVTLVLNKAIHIENSNDAVSILSELIKINFKAYLVPTLLQIFFSKLDHERINILLDPGFMDAWCGFVRQIMSNQAIDLISFMIEQVKSTSAKEIPVRLLVKTIHSANVLLSQKARLNSLFDDCYQNFIASCLLADTAANNANISSILHLHCSLMSFSFEYWTNNCTMKSVKKIVKNASGTPELLAEMVLLHMDRLVDHNMNPPNEELQKCLKLVEELLLENEAAYSVVLKHLPSYCFVAATTSVTLIIDYYILNIKLKEKIPSSFMEVHPIRDLIVYRVFARLQALTGSEFYSLLQPKCDLSGIQNMLTVTDANEIIEESSALVELLEWFAQFPTLYFNSHQGQCIQYAMFHNLKINKCKTTVQLCLLMLWRFMKHLPDSLVTLVSPDILKYILVNCYGMKQSRKIVELTVKKVLQRNASGRSNVELSPQQYIDDVLSTLKEQIKDGQFYLAESFMMTFNDYTVHCDKESKDIPETLTKSIKSFAKRILKSLEGNEVSPSVTPVLHQLCRFYSKQGDLEKVVTIVKEVPRTPEMALFIIDWDHCLSHQEIASFYAMASNLPEVAEKALTLITKQSDPELYKAIVAQHNETFADSLRSFALLVAQDDKCKPI